MKCLGSNLGWHTDPEQLVQVVDLILISQNKEFRIWNYPGLRIRLNDIVSIWTFKLYDVEINNSTQNQVNMVPLPVLPATTDYESPIPSDDDSCNHNASLSSGSSSD